MLRQISLGCVLGAALAATGCVSHHYYEVTEPTSGRTYYTHHMYSHMNGAVTLVDRSTGDKVTLQNSDIRRVTKEEYNRTATR